MDADWSGYLEQLRRSTSADDIRWDDASDLARLSIDSFNAETAGVRQTRSAGSIRLTGEGVDGHTVRLDSAGEVLTAFQRLIVSAGAALSGHKSARGTIPSQIASRTALRLHASPAPGSVVLNFVADAVPQEELAPNGELDLFNPDDKQLVDQAVETSLALISESKDVPADADDSPFIEHVKDHGARFASSLRDFARILADGSLDADLVWEQPAQPRRRVRITAPESRRITELVASRDLAREPATLVGRVQTVSEVTTMQLDTAEGPQHVDTSEIDSETIKQVHVGLVVTVEADVIEVYAPGTESRYKFRATKLVIHPEKK